MPSLGKMAKKAFTTKDLPQFKPDFKASAQKPPAKGQKWTGASYVLPGGTQASESVKVPGNYIQRRIDGVTYAVRKDLVSKSERKDG